MLEQKNNEREYIKNLSYEMLKSKTLEDNKNKTKLMKIPFTPKVYPNNINDYNIEEGDIKYGKK